MGPDRYFRSSVRKYRFSRMEKTLSEASLRVGANKTIKFRPGLQAANPARSLFIITVKQEEEDIGFSDRASLLCRMYPATDQVVAVRIISIP